MLSQKVSHEFGEAFRSLRTSLSFSSGPEPTRCVMVTSAQPLDGKTTTACNLALALAIGGARVLLIDADMRRSGVHRLLKHRERHRAFTRADRSGADGGRAGGARKPENVGDDRRNVTAESVGAAGFGPDADAARRGEGRPVRLGHHRLASCPPRDRRGRALSARRAASCSSWDPR